MDNSTIFKMIGNLQSQDRITRLCLIGTGIVCGLDICVDEDYGVLISSGNGITSDGKYVEIPHGKHFKYYCPFTRENYFLFDDVEEVWELLEEPTVHTEPLKPQSSDEELNPFLKDKVVVIYLPPNPPANLALSEELYPRFLVMHQSDILNVLNIGQLSTRILWEGLQDDGDFIYSDDYNQEDTRPLIDTMNMAMNPGMRLPELYLQRFGFNSGDPENCPPEGVDVSVFPAINHLNDLFDGYGAILDDATVALDQALNQLFNTFGSLLNCINEDQVTTWIDLICLKWETFKKENPTGSNIEIRKKYYIQYFYDWIRDLVQGYNEIRQEIIDLVNECCPDPNQFPQHFLLGIALRPDFARQPQPLRTTLQQPPIYNDNANRLQRIRLYFWREMMMINTFYLPDYILDPEVNPLIEVDPSNKPDFTRFRITPSRFYDAPLGEQSIPFYYPLNWTPYSVHQFWNFNRTRTSSTDHLLSYHASDFDDSYTMRLQAIRPLHYAMDHYPFLRIEGHIGRRLDDVKNELAYLKQKYNLPVRFVFRDIKRPISRSDNECHVTGETQPIEKFTSFINPLLGMNHLAGSKEYGTFIVLYQEVIISDPSMEKIVIADFFLPSILTQEVLDNFKEPDNTSSALKVAPEGVEDAKMDIRGVTTDSTAKQKLPKKVLQQEKLFTKTPKKESPLQRDDLQIIKGIGPKYEEQLNQMGVYTFNQLSQIVDSKYDAIKEWTGFTNSKQKRMEWAEQAKQILRSY